MELQIIELLKNYIKIFVNNFLVVEKRYKKGQKLGTEDSEIWATAILEEYIVKSFVVDDERFKQNKHFGKDYLKAFRWIELAAKNKDAAAQFNFILSLNSQPYRLAEKP